MNKSDNKFFLPFLLYGYVTLSMFSMVLSCSFRVWILIFITATECINLISQYIEPPSSPLLNCYHSSSNSIQSWAFCFKHESPASVCFEYSLLFLYTIVIFIRSETKLYIKTILRNLLSPDKNKKSVFIVEVLLNTFNTKVGWRKFQEFFWQYERVTRIHLQKQFPAHTQHFTGQSHNVQDDVQTIVSTV